MTLLSGKLSKSLYSHTSHIPRPYIPRPYYSSLFQARFWLSQSSDHITTGLVSGSFLIVSVVRSYYYRACFRLVSGWVSRQIILLPLVSGSFLVEEGNCVKQCSENLMTAEHTNKCVPCPVEGCPKREFYHILYHLFHYLFYYMFYHLSWRAVSIMKVLFVVISRQFWLSRFHFCHGVMNRSIPSGMNGLKVLGGRVLQCCLITLTFGFWEHDLYLRYIILC